MGWGWAMAYTVTGQECGDISSHGITDGRAGCADGLYVTGGEITNKY